MTPLAMEYFRMLALESHSYETSEQSLADTCLSLMGRAHFFEATAVLPILSEIGRAPGSALMKTFFLPADVSWIEWRADGTRLAYLLAKTSEQEFEVYQITRDEIQHLGSIENRVGGWVHGNPASDAQAWKQLCWRMMVILAAINTPRLIGRREHLPHRGLQRKLKRSDICGEIELRPWTEILLQVSLPEGDGGGGTRLTGRKCLHFCRSHLRVQNGKLVVVSPHWRGDPALGVKQSVYQVTA